MKLCFAFLMLAVVAATWATPLLPYETFPFTSRIINGEEAGGMIHYQASLYAWSLFRWSHICGAAVIAKEWVVTAAHCVDGRSTSNIRIHANIYTVDSATSEQIYPVRSVIMHESYNQGEGAFPNDIALLHLDTTGKQELRPIDVATDNNHRFDNAECVISGWGVINDGSTPKVLMKADVTVLSEADCNSIWGASNIQPGHICVIGMADENGAGACNGDSGGPLACSGTLAGVTSWGRSGCHDSGDVTHPSVYTRITEYIGWIDSNCQNCRG